MNGLNAFEKWGIVAIAAFFVFMIVVVTAP